MMKIVICYESSWRNSFLDPSTSNNKPLPQEGRKFKGSMTNLKNADNYIDRTITQDTVMGILNRLIGDQRKLYQARNDKHYFFKDIESKVVFNDRPDYESHEVAYIRNITGSTDQNSYTGMIRTDDPIFNSDYSTKLWGVLALNIDELCQFIIDGVQIDRNIELHPLHIISQLDELNAIKPLPNEGSVATVYNILASTFPKFKGKNAKELVMPISLYCSTLYLQLERLSKVYDVSTAKTKAGGLSGISNNGFTKKDFMGRYTTGDKKKIWGNPYMREEFIKGEGKVKYFLKKVGGKLDIKLDIERDQAKEIDLLIKNAGVSSFYLGKKGLAYVSDIRF